MNNIFENEDTLVYLMKYIQNYNLKNMIEDENELHIPYQILLNLSHTNKTFRELILNVKYSFPKINEIMIYYKKNIFIPKLKLELEELNKRKDKIENALYILPIHLNILENKNKNELYINYANKMIHHCKCNYSFSTNTYHPINDNKNLDSMKIFLKKNNLENSNLNNFISFHKYIEYYYVFINFKFCNNSACCKCLYNEVQEYLKKKFKI